ncbi:hypothetical protein [Nocardia sp. NPDC004860]|uniref:hypothetical protein n=1 Tax=Nocardia sp. NPDC004860 TaxID=3154557 RepID=UPI0033A9B9D5
MDGVVSASSVWAVFWFQLPVLVLAIAVIVVGLAAIRRAHPDDVPRVFEAFTAFLSRRPAPTSRRRPRRRPKAPADQTYQEETR